MARIILNSANTAVLIGDSPAFKTTDETASLFAGVQRASFSLPQSRQTQKQVGSCYYSVDDLFKNPDIDLQIDYSFSPSMSNESLMGLDVIQKHDPIFSNPGNRNLVAWWDSSARTIVGDEEDRNIWLDLTENELHLSQIGDVVSDDDGGINGNYAYFESGISDGWGHLEIDGQNCKELAIPEAQTYSAWINPSVDSPGVARFICSKQEQGSKSMLFYIDANGSLKGMIQQDPVTTQNEDNRLWGYTAETIPTNQWTHVAMVFDPQVSDPNDKMQLYISGIKRDVSYQQPLATGITGCNVDYSVPFRIGKRWDADGRQFDGKIDELAVFNKALTKEEIVWLSMNNYYESVGKSIISKLKDKSYNFYFYNHPNQNFDAIRYLKDASTNSPNNGEIISFGNAYLENYSLSFADGSIPTASITFKCSNMKAENYTGDIQTPAINLLSGNNIGAANLDVSETRVKYQDFFGLGINLDLTDPILQQPGDFILNLQNLQVGGQSIGGSDHMIKTMSINIPINRVDLQGLGSNYTRGRKMQYPSKGTLQVSSLVSKYETGFVSGLLNNESTYEFSVKARSCNQEIECDFNFYDLKLETFDYSVNVNEEMQYNAGFSFYIGKE